MAAAVWTLAFSWWSSKPQAPTFGRPKDLEQANVDVPLGVDCLSPMDCDRGHKPGFGEEDCDHLFGNASRSLEFNGWALTSEKARLKTAALFPGHTDVQKSRYP